MERNFNTWLAGFRNSIADYGYYIVVQLSRQKSKHFIMN